MDWPFGQKVTAALAVITAAGMVWALTASGVNEPTAPVRRLVFVGPETAQTDSRYLRFRNALQQLEPNWQSQVKLEYVLVRVDDSRQTDLDMAQAVSTAPHVLVASNAACALAAQRSTLRGSLVFVSVVDPVSGGIVQSLHTPGRRTTGVSVVDELEAKRFELLRDAFPQVTRVGVLVDKGWPQYLSYETSLAQPAAKFQMSITPFLANSEDEVDRVMHGADARLMQAWYVPHNYITFLAGPQIIKHIKRLNVPSLYTTEQAVSQGALLAYAQDTTFIYEALASLTLRILRGEDAGSIPIQRPKKFILAVRPRDDPGTPQIDPSVIRRADRVY
jgi:putative tryptophan/tyrosine transport system substrate-binding protein